MPQVVQQLHNLRSEAGGQLVRWGDNWYVGGTTGPFREKSCGCHDVALPATTRLRLYHHHDGARIAYRETGTGPPLALLHSLGLSHREWEPVVGELSSRFRVVLPDLPLHGDSEDRPRHPYTADWLAEVIAGFCREVGGPRPLIAGHDIGAEIALRAVVSGRVEPARLALMPNRLHRRDEFAGKRAAWRAICRARMVRNPAAAKPIATPVSSA